MKAFGIMSYGGPESLQPLDLADPHPRSGEVRVRVHAAAVNPVDAFLRKGSLAGLFTDLDFPFVPGMDASGVIDKVGDGVSQWQKGDEVICVLDHRGVHGAYSELIVVPEKSVVAKPDDMPFDAAASFLMNALTAQLALQALGLPKGSSVGVTGGSGAVGGFAIELASLGGMHVIADALEEDRELITLLGAQEIVIRAEGSLPNYRNKVPDGLGAVIDGAVLLDGAVPALREGGLIATFRAWDSDPGRGISVLPVNVRTSVCDTAVLTELVEHARMGNITPRVAAVLPAEQVVEAHRMLDAGKGVRGRIVLEF